MLLLKRIAAHLEEYGESYMLVSLFLLFIVFFMYGCLSVHSLIVDINDKESLVAKVDEYEKILEREFGRTFDFYNEYLVYKIENGGVE